VKVDWKEATYIGLVFLGCSLIALAPFLAIFGVLWFLSNIHWLVIIGVLTSAVSCFLLTPCFVKGREPSDVPPEILAALQDVVHKAGLKKPPKLKVVDAPEVNAMAYYSPLGPRIALTSGLIQQYKQGTITVDEAKAVIAHEVSHLQKVHPFKSSIAMSIISLTDVFSSFMIVAGALFTGLGGARRSFAILSIGLGSICFGAIMKVLSKLASIISFHYMRTMEYEADAMGAKLVGREPMISMLKKVDGLNSQVKTQNKLFMPEKWTLPTTNRSWFEKLFDTHPPTQKRIERLMSS